MLVLGGDTLISEYECIGSRAGRGERGVGVRNFAGVSSCTTNATPPTHILLMVLHSAGVFSPTSVALTTTWRTDAHITRAILETGIAGEQR